MKRWADAPVQALRVGHAGHPTALGATRAVALPWAAGQVEQVITRCEPPRAYSYQAVQTPLPGLRSYRGTIELQPEGATIRLSFCLELALSPALRGVEPVLRAVLTAWMQRELDALQAQLSDPAVPAAIALPPTAGALGEDLPAALQEARGMLAEERLLSQAMQAAGDPKHRFVQLCQFVTEEVLALVESGQLPHPSWALRLLSLQHGRFLRNLRCWLSPGLGAVEAHWQSAFTALDLAGEATTPYAVLTGLHLALRAQIEHDLPQTLAQMLRGGLPGDCARYRADLHVTSLACRAAIERMLAAAAAPHLPRWLGPASGRLLAESLEYALRRWGYDVVRQRHLAFERGVRLAASAAAPKAAATSRQAGACGSARGSAANAA
jgi:hypothetical protein